MSAVTAAVVNGLHGSWVRYNETLAEFASDSREVCLCIHIVRGKNIVHHQKQTTKLSCVYFQVCGNYDMHCTVQHSF